MLEPTITFAAEGSINRASRVFSEVTDSVAVDVKPPSTTRTIVFPAASPVATPCGDTVATVASSTSQDASSLASSVVPSL